MKLVSAFYSFGNTYAVIVEKWSWYTSSLTLSSSAFDFKASCHFFQYNFLIKRFLCNHTASWYNLNLFRNKYVSLDRTIFFHRKFKSDALKLFEVACNIGHMLSPILWLTPYARRTNLLCVATRCFFQLYKSYLYFELQSPSCSFILDGKVSFH